MAMENQNQKQETQRINVGALKSLLLQRKITRPRFKWNMPVQDASDILLAAYIGEVEYRKRTYIDDARIRDNIQKVAEFLTNNNSKFGMMFCGTCGNGKTTLLYALRSATNYLNDCRHFEDNHTGIRIYDAKEVSQIAKNYESFKEVRRVPIIALEDIGREPAEVLDYGNVLNPIIDLLEYRYNEQLPTFITTNLTAKEIREKYGNRIADRFNEMIEVLIFQNGSYRK